MQQPRRTTEFNEEPANIRSRQQQRSITGPSPLPGTAKKYATRQSRIALRQPSLDRNSGNYPNLLTVPSGTASASKRGCTPHKSPSARYETARVLFTAEKRIGVGISFHNDKKWISEQTQRITEFLRSNEIEGIGTEFFTRGGLRQMSVKQFVTIINYFLQFVGNRTSIDSSNHVEQIINILQRLHYPHQVNKSWLKTPITQSSFGHVIILFDYFMDFVPFQQNEASAEDLFFTLDESQTILGTCTGAGDDLRILDTEFHQQTIRDAEEGFMLWDKNLTKNFQNLQLKTCEALILKRCGVSSQALENLNAELKKNLAELEKKQIPESKYEEEQLKEKKAEFDSIVKEIEELRRNMNYNVNIYKQLSTNKKTQTEEFANIKQKIAKLKADINVQIWSVEERDKQLLELDYLHHFLQSQQRTLDASKEKSHRQQVQLSRFKKDLVDQVEKFNKNLRSITEYQLPCNLNINTIKSITERLQSNRQKLKTQMEANIKERQAIEELNAKLCAEIKLYKRTTGASVHDKLMQVTSTLKLVEMEYQNKVNKLEMEHKNCTDALIEADNNIEIDKKLVLELQHENVLLEVENEKFMCEVESEHKKRATEYKLLLDRCEEQVNVFEKLIMNIKQKK